MKCCEEMLKSHSVFKSYLGFLQYAHEFFTIHFSTYRFYLQGLRAAGDSY